MDIGQLIIATLIGSLLSGAVVVTFIQLGTQRWRTSIEETVTDSFRRQVEVRDADRALLSEVLGPVNGNLLRTKAAFARYRGIESRVLEVEVMAKSNRAVRDILINKFHLLPDNLLEPAAALIRHYDLWFVIYDTERNSGKPIEEQAKHIYAGPEGEFFPHEADQAFLDEMRATLGRLRGA